MVILLYKWFIASLLLVPGNNIPGDRSTYSLDHPFYVTVTEISHNAGDKNLEISCKIFTDDFETALLKENGVKIDLSNVRDKQVADKQIAEYLKNTC